MGNTCCSVPSVEEAESAQKFRQVDTNNNNLVDRSEMAVFIKGHPELWAMLSVNLGLSEEVCQQTATRVAMELGSGKEGAAAMISELTEAQFHAFRSKYMVNGKGSQEFFHRCVFASFVKNGKHYLDAHSELDAFLDTFYKAGSIFEGDTRLPPKEELKVRITRNNPSGKLTFDEIRDVIRGTTSISRTSNAVVSTTTRHSTMSESNPAAAESTPPEETPELSPPSVEFSAHFDNIPEQTPELHVPSPPPPQNETPKETTTKQPEEDQGLPPPSPTKQKARQRKPKTNNNTSNNNNSDRKDRTTSRSRSPSTRRKSVSRSRSPSSRQRRAGRSGSPSQRKLKRTASRSGSPSQRKPRAGKKETQPQDDDEEPQQPQQQQQHAPKLKKATSSTGSGSNISSKKRNNSNHGTAKQTSKTKSQ